jgi:arylsulfatase A-like enzyme
VTDRRPNILVFMPDQLRADCVGAFGSPVAHTPNIDALAARGVRFDNAWTQHPVCGPSRVSFMTGWYPHVAGHRTLDRLLTSAEPNLLRSLREAGYQVSMPGHRGDVFAPGVTEESTDFCGFLVQPDLRAFVGPVPEHLRDRPIGRAFYHGSSGPDTVVDFDEATILTAIEWIDRCSGDGPWAMWVPLIFPHVPFAVEEPWFSMHDRSAIPDPVSASSGRGKPAFMEVLRREYGWDELTSDDLREIAATYHGMISRVDHQLGRVLDAIDRAGQTDDTLVVFMTDHGEYLGDWGLVEKWPSGMDPCLLRNPLVIAGPGVAEGRVCDALVEIIDVNATLLDRAGAAPTHANFGRSLVSLCERPEGEFRSHVFSEGGFSPTDVDLFERSAGAYEVKSRVQHERPELVGKAISVRTRTHTFVYRQCESDELYDRSADPMETVNLIDDPAQAATVAALRAAMFEWLVETSDVIPAARHPRFPGIPQGWREGLV